MKTFKFALFRQIFCFAALHQPGIETGSIAWEATILPLNHRCLILNALIVPAKFCSIIQVFHQGVESKSWKLCFLLIEVSNSANYLSSFPLFWQWHKKNWRNVKLHFLENFFCFSALHRQGIEPWSIVWKATMLQLNHRCLIFICFNRLNKNFALHFNFSPSFRIKIMNDSFHLSFELQLFIWVVFFFESGTIISYKILRLLFLRNFFLLCIDRESNTGLSCARRQFYHWTTNAWFTLF